MEGHKCQKNVLFLSVALILTALCGNLYLANNNLFNLHIKDVDNTVPSSNTDMLSIDPQVRCHPVAPDLRSLGKLLHA